MSARASADLPSVDAGRHRYDRAQRLFHWSMALIIVVAIGLGVVAAYLPPGTSPRRELLDLHKSLGLTALVLIVLRVAYRLVRGEPPYRRPLAPATHAAARLAHLALYGLMIAMPLSGYVDSGAGGYSLPWFGLFTWPRLVPLDTALSHRAGEVHWLGAWALGGLVALHVAAVAWHAWRRDEVPSRMIASFPAPRGDGEAAARV